MLRYEYAYRPPAVFLSFGCVFTIGVSPRSLFQDILEQHGS